MITETLGPIEMQYSVYDLSNSNEIDSSIICYNDIVDSIKSYGLKSIISIEVINDFEGGEIWQYERLLRTIESNHNDSLIVVPLHTLKHYECKEFIEVICIKIDGDTFLPFPYNKYCRYIYTTSMSRQFIDMILKPQSATHRICQEILKTESRYKFIKDNFRDHNEQTIFKYSNIDTEELKEYTEFLKEYLHMPDCNL